MTRAEYAHDFGRGVLSAADQCDVGHICVAPLGLDCLPLAPCPLLFVVERLSGGFDLREVFERPGVEGVERGLQAAAER